MWVALIQSDCALSGDEGTDTHGRKATWRHEPRRQASEDTDSVHVMIPDF